MCSAQLRRKHQVMETEWSKTRNHRLPGDNKQARKKAPDATRHTINIIYMWH